ncbi:hypothetical protein ALC57_08974 [Trachymyrmex cornetzi]|uniref:Uncharacterized protein n=1 Tax=Trachymyrmex cornetzi TaxID=471704 RepID=A0A151J684_9HYME|nr:hypothetical protein ALC57_08974 [Trachymyrmex cornetzi]
MYCQTEQTKLSRHLMRKHNHVKEVKDILCIPKGRSERRALIRKIRKNGQYVYNTNPSMNTGELKVMRRPKAKLIKDATDYSSSIARTAVETQFQKRRQSKKLLPTQSDIKKLESFLNDRLKVAYDSLKQTFSLKTWEVLAESCLLSIQLFNRRRPGEIERALIEDFKNYQEVNESSIGISYQSLSPDEKKAAEKYVRFTMRGKLGRSVPVLLHKQMLKNVQLLLRYRKTTNVHPKNPYLFGVPGTLKGDYRYLRACDLIRKYLEECGAEHPDRLRGTNLRKHIATMCTNLNLREDEVSDLANFMGHADKIHKEHYRQPILSREIFQVSKLLEIVHGKDSDVETEKNDTENICNVSGKIILVLIYLDKS